MWGVLAQVPLPDIGVTAEESRTGIYLLLISNLLNAILFAFNTYYTKKNANKLELARIASESAERIAQINADAAKEAHKRLSAKLDAQTEELQSSIANGPNP